VKIIDIDLQRRRISLSIKQAAEGGEVAEEYREHFGEHAFDEHGNYIGPAYDAASYEEAWAEYEQIGTPEGEGAEAAEGAETGEAAPESAEEVETPVAEAEAPAPPDDEVS
jgi:small subunit ribosomal protein S1